MIATDPKNAPAPVDKSKPVRVSYFGPKYQLKEINANVIHKLVSDGMFKNKDQVVATALNLLIQSIEYASQQVAAQKAAETAKLTEAQVAQAEAPKEEIVNVDSPK